MKKLKRNKIVIILICAIIIFSYLRMCGIKIAEANTIKECESQISINNTKIEKITEIKNQLHITANLLREEGSLNDGLDVILSQKWHEYNDYANSLKDKNISLTTKIEKIKNSKKFIGYFKITHYCSCSICNGSYIGTAIGTEITPGRTIAVDPKVIPLGAKVEIEGKVYTSEDTGSVIKGNRIDVAVSSHSEAYRLGVKHNVPVYIITE